MKKEELYILVKSLSKSEKRYFKLFCAKEVRGGNHLKLFDAMDKQAEYDEQAIKAQFKGEKFVKQLHVTKNYLRNLILKSLRNFHTELSKDAALKDILRNIEILYSKELFQHCKTELKRANSIARKYELLPGMIEVENWNRKIEQVMSPHHYAAFNAALAEQAKVIDLLQKSNDYWQLGIRVSMIPFGEAVGPIPHDDLLNDPDQALTLEAKVLYYNIKYLHCVKKGATEQAGQELYTLIGLLEKFPERLQATPGLYVSSINNLVSYLVFVKKHEEALQLIQQAKSKYDAWGITTENRMLLKQILRTYNIELEIYRDTRTFQQKTDFIKTTEAFVNANRYKMPKEYLLSFWFQLASIYFMRKDFEQSLHWINLVLNTRFKGIRTDLRVQTRMLNLMVHLEQQNLFVLRYYVDSTRRYLKKVKGVQPFEKILLHFFVKMGRIPFEEYKSAFALLKKQLFPEEGKAIIPPDVLGYIDYGEWIEGKLI